LEETVLRSLATQKTTLKLVATDESLINKQIIAALAKLDPECLEVVSNLFGLAGHEPSTAEEIGEKLGTSGRDIEDIEADALRALANYGSRAGNKQIS
jgi:DNA-directed RNA polymerase sigma subunit (sigma70/sigma32)